MMETVLKVRVNKKMDKFAEQIAKKHPESVSEAVLKAREEEDEIL